MNPAFQWWVVNTSFMDYALIVRCAKTQETGMIEDPSPEEWRAAFSAPTNPYPLDAAAYGRVQLVEQDPDTKKWRKKAATPTKD